MMDKIQRPSSLSDVNSLQCSLGEVLVQLKLNMAHIHLVKNKNILKKSELLCQYCQIFHVTTEKSDMKLLY
jgi:hypothetical protein